MKTKEDELNKVIDELKQNISSLQKKLAEEEFLKLDATISHKREKEARDQLEKFQLQAALSEEHQRAKQEIMDINQKRICTWHLLMLITRGSKNTIKACSTTIGNCRQMLLLLLNQSKELKKRNQL